MIDKFTIAFPNEPAMLAAAAALLYDKNTCVTIVRCRHHQDEPKPGCAVCDLIRNNAAAAA